jgi:diaminohydroxyphosphoribosylaminopyrimidine deaminase/5-amino-6-(5-phosphoribosylamino)uracil reductase
MTTSFDMQTMAHAFRLAARGQYSTHPNPSVGCVIVQGETIVGEGWHQKAGEAHAEVNAIQNAGERVKDAALYVTLEPCCHHGRTPPCTDAIIRAGIDKVFVGSLDPNPKVSGQGVALLKQHGIQVELLDFEQQNTKLNRGFVQRMRTGRPWVVSKIAMSLDGNIAMANGESQWITGEHARRDAQHLRARSDAILTGSGTVKADDPALTVREEKLLKQIGRQPLRVILDTRSEINKYAKVFKQSGETLIVKEHADAENVLPVSVDQQQRIQLPELMQKLGEREINQILVEAGPKLNGALLAEQLVDEIIFYIAPKILGNNSLNALFTPHINALNEAVNFTIKDVRQVGKDLRIMTQPDYTSE